MKNTMKIGLNFWMISFCSFLFISIAGCGENKKSIKGTTDLLPAPQIIEFSENVSLRPKDIKTIYLYAHAGKEDQFAAHLLQDKINTLFHYKIKIKKVDSYNRLSQPAIILGIPSADQDFLNFCSELKLPAPQKNTNESYVLNVRKNIVVISGGGKAGLFYGLQTLNQLLEDAKWGDQSLQGRLIQDWPDIKLRWVHFDEKHHLDRYNYLKKAIVKLARYKINGVVFEFEDKFDYQSHAILAAPHSFTPEQIKELTQYAHKYHIDIIPLVQGLGHAGYILKHPEFRPLRADPQSYWAFNPLQKGTYDLLFDLYRETIKATPGVKYFHVGGDEVRFTGNNPQLQAYKKEHGEFSLYLQWLNKVNSFMEKQGRTLIFWDDMPLKIAGLWRLIRRTNISDKKFDSLWSVGTAKLDKVVDKFPKDAVYMQWTYGKATEGNARLIHWFEKHEIKEMSATAIQNSRPLIPSYEKKPANIKSFITLSAKEQVPGELCTAWDDSGLHFETFWMGFLASAEYAWNYKTPASIRQYWNKYIYRFFGPNTKGLYKAFHNLSKRVGFWYSNIMKKGTKRDYRKDRKEEQLIELPSLKNVPEEGSWTVHYKSLIKKAKGEKEKNARAIETLKENMDRVKRNAYNLEVFVSMGNFMKADANLVLAIGKIAKYADHARVAEKKNQPQKIAANLNKMAATADSAWNIYKASYENLKKVWQISRFPKGGRGFIPFRYGHFASRREDLSYLTMAEDGLDLPEYAQKLHEMANHYEKFK